jgi:hypothetical protein
LVVSLPVPLGKRLCYRLNLGIGDGYPINHLRTTTIAELAAKIQYYFAIHER